MRTWPPGPAASTALSTRFNSSCRNCSSSADKRACQSAGQSTRSSTLRCGRPANQLHQLVDERPQIAIGAAGGLRAAGGQKTLQMFFGQRQLPQGDGQTFLVDVAAMPLMQLHGDPAPVTSLRK